MLAAKPGLYRTIIQTGIYTGGRISELLALRWADVNLDGGTLAPIRSALSRSGRAVRRIRCRTPARACSSDIYLSIF